MCWTALVHQSRCWCARDAPEQHCLPSEWSTRWVQLHLPDTVLVKFYNAHVSCVRVDGQAVPTEQTMAKLHGCQGVNLQCTRLQLLTCWVATIDKVQDVSLDATVIDSVRTCWKLSLSLEGVALISDKPVLRR